MPRRQDQNMDRGPGRFEVDPNNQRGRHVRNLDPYVLDQGLREPAVCTDCHAIYRNKRWYLKEKEYVEIRAGEEVHEVVCPACEKIGQNYPEGIVTLRGDYLWQHEEEIRNILRNIENTAMAKNPLERIMSIKPEGDALVIETTEEKLAEHIGRALHRAHQGHLDVDWSDNHSLCRVTWERAD
jgi:NMD protein affecting ribosome stability and mRNA decay